MTGALNELHLEARGLFSSMHRVSMATTHYREFFLEQMATSYPDHDWDKRVLVGSGDPKRPDGSARYYTTTREFSESMADDGVDMQRVRNSFFLYLYDLWRDKYQRRIADEVGLPDKDRVKSEFFSDLGTYRNSITHNRSFLKRSTNVLAFCQKGESISLSRDETFELFRLLVKELNRLGEVYYDVNPKFTYARPT